MVVKGSIGETCTVEAKIVGIRVLEEGTFYDLELNGVIVHGVEEQLINFSDYFADPAEYDYKLQETAFPEEPAEITGLPVDDEWSRPAPKKRGRPRKATVEDLVKRAKEGDHE